MIEEILPATVMAFDTFTDPPEAVLFPEEAELVRRAADKRRREFTTARHCVHRALERLGVPPSPVLTGAHGEPAWPPGVVGSITHCAGYRAAAVSAAPGAIGIDAEPEGPLPPGVLEAVAVAEECEQLRRLAAEHPGTSWDRILFSAKESVYKAWYPLARRWLDFQDAVIDLDPVRGTFEARLLVTGPRWQGRRVSGFTGRWMAGRGLVLTAIAVTAPPGARPATRPAA
ncbi:4'-phosphopantetheinyl transferase superfamily protein [Actinomadura sp. ATCC 31491]|uniref:4'-phosphopantetheinyl transferase superfamily protein n=1 Tax=Actinomadura luzonensis TaxID=2805427 RepID=A0ABT0FVA2_9ACTN|nr:4'-phosphopantetheinyl transferase superfamily protein [Actinomadura luzonensis]MCK2216261.1 4'-phosphopantetheinyl transferase superfamily protein [Actinomadura luzonensis]